MERAWGLSLEEGPWVQRLARLLDSHAPSQGWLCPPGLACRAISQAPATRVSQAQGRIEEKCRAARPTCPTQSSSDVASLCSPPSSRPGRQAASWRPVVSTDSLRRLSTTGRGPVASGGAPGGPHSLSPPRPGSALPARSLEAQTLTSPPRWRSLLRLPCAHCRLGGRSQGCRWGPLGVRLTRPALAVRAPHLLMMVRLGSSGCQAHPPCPRCQGAPTS